MMIDTTRFSQALSLATELHATQLRKGGLQAPFICHPLAVASLVIENGGTEDEAIAGLLHDAVEDQGGLETYNLILKTFGENVASIVTGCTDAWEFPKPPWKERKKQHIEKLNQASQSVLLVYACDKIHNLRCLISEYRQNGEDIWNSYKGGKEGTLWYYSSVIEIFQRTLHGNIVIEATACLEQLLGLVRNEQKNFKDVAQLGDFVIYRTHCTRGDRYSGTITMISERGVNLNTENGSIFVKWVNIISLF